MSAEGVKVKIHSGENLEKSQLDFFLKDSTQIFSVFYNILKSLS